MADLKDTLAQIAATRKSGTSAYDRGWNEAMKRVAEAVESHAPDSTREWAMKLGNGDIRNPSVVREMVQHDIEVTRKYIEQGRLRSEDYEPISLVWADITPRTITAWSESDPDAD
jgi:hypothetical protein